MEMYIRAVTKLGSCPKEQFDNWTEEFAGEEIVERSNIYFPSTLSVSLGEQNQVSTILCGQLIYKQKAIPSC